LPQRAGQRKSLDARGAPRKEVCAAPGLRLREVCGVWSWSSLSWLGLLALVACERPAPPHHGPEPGSGLRGKATVGVILERAAEGELVAGGVTWRSAALVISDVELHACEQGWRWPSLVGDAYAHVPGSAMRLGTPMAIELLGAPGKARIIGESAPPHVAICAMEVILAPADADVINVTELDAGALEGRTFVARGVDAAGAEVTVSLALRRAVRVEVPPGALVVRRDEAEVFALVQLAVGPELLEGLERMGEEEAERVLVARLGEKMKLYGGK
jgi:hypothetical protein